MCADSLYGFASIGEENFTEGQQRNKREGTKKKIAK